MDVPQLDQLLLDYEIERQVGEGAYASVYFGKHVPSGEKVALKVIKKQKDTTFSKLDFLTVEREKIIWPHLKHPNILRVREVLESTEDLKSFVTSYSCDINPTSAFCWSSSSSSSCLGLSPHSHLTSTPSMNLYSTPVSILALVAPSPAPPKSQKEKAVQQKKWKKERKKQTRHWTVIATEYCGKGDLLKYVKEQGGRLTEDAARKLFISILAAVDYLHSNSIVHRDIKLENILMDDKGEPKLADFGFATQWEQNKTINEYIGSISYSAPELILGTPYTGPEVDVWALGVLLFGITTGKLPFAAPREEDTRSKIVQGMFFSPTILSDDLRDLLRKILVPDREKRYKISKIVSHPWIQSASKKYLSGKMSFSEKFPIEPGVFMRLDNVMHMWEDVPLNQDIHIDQDDGGDDADDNDGVVDEPSNNGYQSASSDCQVGQHRATEGAKEVKANLINQSHSHPQLPRMASENVTTSIMSHLGATKKTDRRKHGSYTAGNNQMGSLLSAVTAAQTRANAGLQSSPSPPQSPIIHIDFK